MKAGGRAAPREAVPESPASLGAVAAAGALRRTESNQYADKQATVAQDIIDILGW